MNVVRRHSPRWAVILSIAAVSVFGYSACGVPNLEPEECVRSRESVKRFYSLHFGTDLRAAADLRDERSTYLTDDLLNRLPSLQDQAVDYFTKTSESPKSFRVGRCLVISGSETELQVVLLWRDDTRSDQAEVKVKSVLTGEKWSIDDVNN